jgi:predicted RNase H-like nuclease (RuvC/YqgF family)
LGLNFPLYDVDISNAGLTMSTPATLETIAASLVGIAQQVEALGHKVEMLDQKVQALDHRVEMLDQKVQALDHRVEMLDQKVTTLEVEQAKTNLIVETYQKTSTQVVNLAFGLLATATITVIVTSVFK